MFLEIKEIWCLVVTQLKLTDTLPITLSKIIICHHALHDVVLAYVSNSCTILWLCWLLSASGSVCLLFPPPRKAFPYILPQLALSYDHRSQLSYLPPPRTLPWLLCLMVNPLVPLCPLPHFRSSWPSPLPIFKMYSCIYYLSSVSSTDYKYQRA